MDKGYYYYYCCSWGAVAMGLTQVSFTPIRGPFPLLPNNLIFPVDFPSDPRVQMAGPPFYSSELLAGAGLSFLQIPCLAQHQALISTN